MANLEWISMHLKCSSSYTIIRFIFYLQALLCLGLQKLSREHLGFTSLYEQRLDEASASNMHIDKCPSTLLKAPTRLERMKWEPLKRIDVVELEDSI